MTTLTDIGLAPSGGADTTPPVPTTSPPGLVPGSVKARLLYGAYAGQPVQVVNSPPGAGKTSLIIEVLEILLRRSAFELVVACPTKRGAYDLSSRLVEALGTGPDSPAVIHQLRSETPPPGAFPAAAGVPKGRRTVTVRTVASCTYAAPQCDILFFDEAYQVTFADAMAAADCADRVVLVGDPGQIGPVITQDTSAWEGTHNAPHVRAPEIFAARDDAVVLELDATYRLGQPTVEAIAPLYGFEFGSRRPRRIRLDRDGSPVPELTSTVASNARSVGDIEAMRIVAQRAASMVGTTVRTTRSNGLITDQVLTDADVAVVVSHNVQASTIQSLLRERSRGGISVGTADRMQGGQWHAVVALDPLVGHLSVSSHQINLGRLCVMASRHMSSLMWVHDGEWEDKLEAASREHAEAAVGAAVRRRLTR